MAGRRYRDAMTTLDAIRNGIRRGRHDRRMTLEVLVERSGVAKKVLHQMENPNKYPDYSPEIDTVIRIVEDGFELSLCSFVCWAEGQALPDVGLPEMPESLRRAVVQRPPKGQSTESSRATPKAGNSKRPSGRHR